MEGFLAAIPAAKRVLAPAPLRENGAMLML
jgi:hypothetical protein